MRIRQSLTTLVLLFTSTIAQALSCVPGPQFELGDEAHYRFTENGDPAVDLSIKAVEKTSIEMVFSIQEGDASYLVSYPLYCGFGFTGELESDLVAPIYTNFYRIRELIDITPWVFGPEDPATHINRVSNGCSGGTATAVVSCVTIYDPAAENGAVKVELHDSNDLNDDPINRLISKTQHFADGRVDTIEKQEDHNPGASTVAMPQLSSATVYSGTAAEIFWARAPAADNIVAYEIQRGGETATQLDGTSFFDSDRRPGVDYVYSISALRADGQKSNPATIVADAFGGYVPSGGGPGSGPDVPNVLPPVDVLTASVYSETAAEIFWTRVETTVPVRYEIWRNNIAVGEINGTSYFDGDLMPGLRYDYAVFVKGPATLISSGASVSLTTPGIASAPPASGQPTFSIDHIVYSNTAVELFWPGYLPTSSTGFRYDVYRDGALVGVTDGKSYFTDGLEPERSYQFQVFVFDARNEQIALSHTANISAGFNNSGGPTPNPTTPDPVGGDNPSVSFELIYESDLTAFCNDVFNQPRYQTLRSSQELNDFYSSLQNCTDATYPPPPTANVENATLLMVSEPVHGYGGPTIDIDSITRRGNMLSVDVLRTDVGINCAADSALSAPFKIYRINETPELIDFVERLELQPPC